MTYKRMYENRLPKVLADESICPANRQLFKEFFRGQEYKLQRTNQLIELDEGCYKTLGGYITKFIAVNRWFKNKPWVDLTEADIKQVYDDLEDGKILTKMGKPYQDRRSYYNKIFKGKPFKLAGKDQIARSVIEYYCDRKDKQVRFLDEENFLKMEALLSKASHRLLFWLAWDVGENINTLLQLTKQDITRQTDLRSQEVEYLVNLPKEKLKRSRTPRSEVTLYPETTQYFNMILPELNETDKLFSFEYRQAVKILHAAIKRSGAVCRPANDRVKWKDFRSGMACHLLKKGWNTDEVNFRLGHKASSKEIDAYVSHLALDRRKPKQKLQANQIEQLQHALSEAHEHIRGFKNKESLLMQRSDIQEQANQILQAEMLRIRRDVTALVERA